MLNISVENLFWLAGLLEGEGSFIFTGGSPRITMATVDLDVAQKVHSLLSCTSNITEDRTVTLKNIYKINLQGAIAIDWMKFLSPLMSIRRREKIREVVEEYNKYKASTNYVNHRDKIRIIDGKKVCIEHGPVELSNVLYVGKYIRCKGCYTRV
jgi:hypothetical protein